MLENWDKIRKFASKYAPIQMAKVTIIKYNAGNICSVVNAFKRLGIVPTVSDDPNTILSSSHIVFPGQGEARTTMSYLQSHGLDKLLLSLRQPVLGICIGMQLMCRHSEEDSTDCLGIFDIDVKRFVPQVQSEKVPQMGWNSLEKLVTPLFRGISENSYAYFIHSYYVPICPHTISTTQYIQPYSSALHKDNYYATQFHPEKSGKVGEQILKNFLDL